jgi:hypothetical protein
MKGVQRIDTGRTHGWQGRIWDAGEGRRRTKFFVDKKHGSLEKARRKARAWRKDEPEKRRGSGRTPGQSAQRLQPGREALESSRRAGGAPAQAARQLAGGGHVAPGAVPNA